MNRGEGDLGLITLIILAVIVGTCVRDPLRRIDRTLGEIRDAIRSESTAPESVVVPVALDKAATSVSREYPSAPP